MSGSPEKIDLLKTEISAYGVPERAASSSAYGGGKTLKECESMIQKSLRTPMVRFLSERLQKAGCPVGDNFFRAVNWDGNRIGCYIPGEGIIVCMNKINLQDEVNQVITHQLINAFDECRAANLDWNNCAHHACSEIRANHLSCDCHYKREVLRSHLKIRGYEQECMKRRVMASVSGNPNCSEAAAKDAMEAVWHICYNDTQPFDRVS